MNKLELQKTANEIRKGIVTAVHSAKSRASGRFPVCNRGVLHISILKK